MKRITITNYKSDKYYARIVRAVSAILSRGSVVAPVEVLMEMGLLRKDAYEDWRLGRVPYLERVILCNLAKASRILRILRMHAHDLNLCQSHTEYRKWGKGAKFPLRFTKTGDRPLEAAYSRHFTTIQAVNAARRAAKEALRSQSHDAASPRPDSHGT